MQKTAFFAAAFVFFLSSFSFMIHAQDDLVPMKRTSSSQTQQNLVDLNNRETTNRIQELERRIDDIERERNFQEERIRNLERTVNDLRRLQR